METTISYHDFRRKAQGCLTQLREAGIQPGDEVIIQVPDNESFLYSFWGCILGKAVAVPVPIATPNIEALAEKIEQLRNCSNAGVVLAGNVVSQAGGSTYVLLP